MNNLVTPNAQLGLVVFDLFGTLIRYGIMYHPFRQLMKWAKDNGRKPESDDARKLMTIDGGVPKLVDALGINAPDFLIEKIQSQIQEELASLTLYYDVIPTLSALQSLNIPFAICSNLAQPYGKAIDLLLGEYSFIRSLSYEVGCIKPEPGIYQTVVNQSKVAPEKCLFVGDTLLADYEGPREFGMRAYHLVRDVPSNNSISSLRALIE